MPSSAGGWTTARDIHAQLQRRWDRGELLRPLVEDECLFPMRLNLKGPDSAALTDSFDAVRTWVAELAEVTDIRIEWREVQHRVQGRQRLPQQIWVDQLPDALSLLGKRREAEVFTDLVEQTRAGLPALLPWLVRRPLRALEIAPHWPRLLDVVRWISQHPRPGMYLRQVDLPGVHSKGDIDTHGFAILDQLRGRLAQARSVLMDRETLLAHQAHWGEEPEPVKHDLPRLEPAERELYDDLRKGQLRPRLRLEQERIGFNWVARRLDDVLNTPD